MAVVLKYRGRSVSASDVSFISALIAQHPRSSRRALSFKLCEAWNWVQANGSPRDMVCRGLMLALHRAGHITLPPVRQIARIDLASPEKPAPIEIRQSPIFGGLKELRPLEIRQVRRRPEEALVNSLIESYHYLGYTQPVGEHLKYLVRAHDRPIACFCWSSAVRHLFPRDQHIGWSIEARRANIRYVAYNSRFLILPWVKIPHLASHLLGWMARELSREWEKVYAHPVYFAETFIDITRYRGTCYRAANWVYLGETTGRGKDDQTKRANRPIKEVLGYALVNDFRRRLGATS